MFGRSRRFLRGIFYEMNISDIIKQHKLRRVFAMAEFSRNRFFSSFPSGQMTFGVSTTELNRIYHGDLRMSIQHETGENMF